MAGSRALSAAESEDDEPMPPVAARLTVARNLPLDARLRQIFTAVDRKRWAALVLVSPRRVDPLLLIFERRRASPGPLEGIRSRRPGIRCLTVLQWSEGRAVDMIRGLLSLCVPVSAEVAQLVEHVTENHGVGSSILPLGTI
jgi:hypothetical protein